MLLIQQLSRQHRWWTRGVIDASKMHKFIEKMDSQLGVLDPARTRTRRRAQGVPTASLVVHRQPDTDRWLWWLMIAGREAAVQRLAAAHRETWLDGASPRTPLRWSDAYELRRGGRGQMTWWMQRKCAGDVEAELRYLASGHGRADGVERSDDLQRAVSRARARPMFSGVRSQINAALAKSVRRWAKTHREPWPGDRSPLPTLGRGHAVYADPADVIVIER